MKKLLSYLIPAALLVLSVGCERDFEYENPQDQIISARYVLSFDTDTKTLLGGTGGVSWASGDKIFYYTKQQNLVSKEVEFNGDIPTLDVGSLSPNTDAYINAIYAGGAASPIEAGYTDGMEKLFMITLDVANDEQNFDSFAAAHACAAHQKNLRASGLSFHNIVTVLKFTANTDGVHHVVFTNNDGEPINGDVYGMLKVTFDDDGNLESVVPQDTGTNTIKIKTNGEQRDFYFAIIPKLLGSGFTVTAYDSSNQEMFSASKAGRIDFGISETGAIKPKVVNLGTTEAWRLHREAPEIHPVTSLELSTSSLEFILDANPGTAQVVATVNEDADEKGVTWSISPAGIAKAELVSEVGNVTTIKITPLAIGDATLTVTTKGMDVTDRKISRECTITVSEPAPEPAKFIDLSANETANCYIAHVLDTTYRFDASVCGNSATPVISNASGVTLRAEVLWEARPKIKSNDNSTLQTGGIISDVEYEDGYITFKAVSDGNAVIALKNQDNKDEILWSWHIWVWNGYNPEVNSHVYLRNGGTVMDRNLGAALAFPTDIYNWSTWGLMYQWGRKDPFFGRETSILALGPGLIQVPEPAYSDATKGTVAYTVANPMVYLLYPTGTQQDWLYAKRDNTLWGADKTMYDPCPPGWKVPDKGLWSRSLGLSSTGSYTSLNDLYPGLDFTGIMASSSYTHVFYPAQGAYLGIEANSYPNIVYGKTYYGYYWTSAGASTGGAYVFSINRTQKTVNTSATDARSCAFNVRCMKDTASSGGSQGGDDPVTPDPGGDTPDPGPVAVTKVTISPTSQSIYQGHSFQLTAVIEPDNATDKSVTWTSGNESVATVSSTGMVTAVAPGTAVITATAKDGSGKSGTCSITVDEASQIDLSANGTANCYVVSSPGDYCFRPVKGNSTNAADALTPTSAQLLWQSYGTSESVGTAVITSVEYSAGMILFTVPKTMKNGNAVIAAYDNGGKILWSWHIWVCSGYDPEASAQVYLEREGQYDKDGNLKSIKLTGKTVATVMDRNLGALSATPGTVGALGLFYQWGRKDPFLGSSINYYAQSQPFAVGSPSTPGTTKAYGRVSVQYSVENPMTFVTVSNSDWQNSSNDPLWSATSKTIYDPCPAGWMVPSGGTNGLWAKSCGVTYMPEAKYDGTNLGVSYTNFTAANAGPVWIPFAGDIQEGSGTLNGVGGYLRVWSATASNATKAYALYQGKSDTFNVVATYVKAEGCSVRCVKEQ